MIIHKLVNLAHSSHIGNGCLGILTDGFKKRDIYSTVFTLMYLPSL